MWWVVLGFFCFGFVFFICFVLGGFLLFLNIFFVCTLFGVASEMLPNVYRLANSENSLQFSGSLHNLENEKQTRIHVCCFQQSKHANRLQADDSSHIFLFA